MLADEFPEVFGHRVKVVGDEDTSVPRSIQKNFRIWYMVQAGRLRIELHKWYSAKGITYDKSVEKKK